MNEINHIFSSIFTPTAHGVLIIVTKEQYEVLRCAWQLDEWVFCWNLIVKQNKMKIDEKNESEHDRSEPVHMGTIMLSHKCVKRSAYSDSP